MKWNKKEKKVTWKKTEMNQESINNYTTWRSPGIPYKSGHTQVYVFLSLFCFNFLSVITSSAYRIHYRWGVFLHRFSSVSMTTTESRKTDSERSRDRIEINLKSFLNLTDRCRSLYMYFIPIWYVFLMCCVYAYVSVDV